MTDYTKEIDRYLQRLFPICRSITGEGNRETLRILQEIVPLQVKEYPSDTPVFDWTIPKEWAIREGYIQNEKKERLIDFQDNNLHVMGYSQPVRGEMSFNELKSHLHYREDLPTAIPYRTTYYKEDWGFCLNYDQYKNLEKEEGVFEVVIDSSFNEKGSLTVGELLIKGRIKKEILISSYICHPSLANDNLSGFLLTAFLAKELLSRKNLNHSYRIIFVPETIGAISYCAMNEEAMRAIDTGLLVTSLGGPGKFGYKQSFNKNHYINYLIEEVFAEEGITDFITYPFDIHGSDERQYSSQGFRINMATISKDKYYEYDYYHTSLDNLDFTKAIYINNTLQLYLHLISKLEQSLKQNQVYRNLYPNCEVMLSKHDLYPKTGGGMLPRLNSKSELDRVLWLLFYCDGKLPLYEIAKTLNDSFRELSQIARLLEEKKILERVDDQ